ncbi:hypothetical protein [Chondromyces apiculatus]|uniref:Uncharacterized protein n=1 Tax=Chondromyces apiculatus DSM 436 TaxID=1192034 RepID=A0A017SY96_9BACT|nr:hypothetical protein [Chondromyces apiculatus]EYF01550.1 Hypothetical protein CAP_7990 [Chondromyces apiculatus DSM 436]
MSGSKRSDSALTMRPPPMTAESGLIISTSFSVSGFGKRWTHCHQLANYLARYASANENDPERTSTLLSTFFNELIEAIYRNHARRGLIQITFERRHDKVCVKAEVPVDEESRRFYERTVELAQHPELMRWYRERLEREISEEDAGALGIVELTVVYGAQIAIEHIQRTDVEGSRSLHLWVEFPFAELDEV